MKPDFGNKVERAEIVERNELASRYEIQAPRDIKVVAAVVLRALDVNSKIIKQFMVAHSNSILTHLIILLHRSRGTMVTDYEIHNSFIQPHHKITLARG